MMRQSARTVAANTASRTMLITATVGLLIGLEGQLAHLLDDHVAAAVLALIVAVIALAVGAPFFAGRR